MSFAKFIKRQLNQFTYMGKLKIEVDTTLLIDLCVCHRNKGHKRILDHNQKGF